MHCQPLSANIFRHAQRILSVKQPPSPLQNLPAVNRQCQNGQDTNQNQMKNTCPFHIVFQILKARLCKIEPPYLLFLAVFISFYIIRYHFSQIFRTSLNIISKKDFRHEFSFYRIHSKPLHSSAENSTFTISFTFLYKSGNAWVKYLTLPQAPSY